MSGQRGFNEARVYVAPKVFLQTVGTIFARFDERTQDSGNVSYGVECDGARYFIKTAGDPSDARSVLDFSARVGLLRNAARLANDLIGEPIVPRLHQVIETPDGPMLVYDWVEGELLNVSADKRSDPSSSFQRFRSLPLRAVCKALDRLFALHVKLAHSGWIACDFYDGALIYDFSNCELHVIDLDTYHPGPFTNTMGRMFGSTRFMAPEEFELGALIDERTTVFTMGRTGFVFLSDGTYVREAFRGTTDQFAVLKRACNIDPDRRYQSVEEFFQAWTRAGN